MIDQDTEVNTIDETEAELEYLSTMESFEIEQAFLDADFDEDGSEVEPE